MGNEVSVYAPSLSGKWKPFAPLPPFRSVIRIWEITPEKAELGICPNLRTPDDESDLAQLKEISSSSCYVVFHRYVQSHDPEKLSEVDRSTTEAFVPAVTMPVSFRSLLTGISESCEDSSLVAPSWNSWILDPPTSKLMETRWLGNIGWSVYLWIGKRASSQVLSMAERTAFNLEAQLRKEEKEKAGSTGLTQETDPFLSSDVDPRFPCTVVFKADLPSLTSTVPELASDPLLPLLLHSNHLFEHLYLNVGHKYLPVEGWDTPTTAPIHPMTSDGHEVRQRKERLRSLFAAQPE